MSLVKIKDKYQQHDAHFVNFPAPRLGSAGRPTHRPTAPCAHTRSGAAAFAVPGKVALWLEDASRPVDIGAVTQDTIALEIGGLEGGRSFFYIPACARMTPELAARIRGAALVFFDGTLWLDDEMIRAGVGLKTGQRMGHLSVAGEGGSMALLQDLNIERKVFIHINTTNPILIDDSPERATVSRAGWEVAYDGMHLML